PADAGQCATQTPQPSMLFLATPPGAPREGPPPGGSVLVSRAGSTWCPPRPASFQGEGATAFSPSWGQGSRPDDRFGGCLVGGPGSIENPSAPRPARRDRRRWPATRHRRGEGEVTVDHLVLDIGNNSRGGRLATACGEPHGARPRGASHPSAISNRA